MQPGYLTRTSWMEDGMTLRIRKAEHDDLEVIVALNHALFQEDAGQRDPYMNLNWAQEEGHPYFARHLGSETSYCLVAEQPGEVVGYLVGYTRQVSSLRIAREAALESIFVRRAFRGRGVGAQLVDAFLAWCREREMQRVAVTAYAANERAIRFYQHAGFRAASLTLERTV